MNSENLIFGVLIALFSIIVSWLLRFLYIYHGEAPLIGAGNFSLLNRSKVVVWRIILGFLIGYTIGILFHIFLCYVHPVPDKVFYDSLINGNITRFQHPNVKQNEFKNLYLWAPYVLPLVPGNKEGGSIAEKCLACCFCVYFGIGFSITLIQLLSFAIGLISNIFTFSPLHMIEGGVEAMWKTLHENHVTVISVPGGLTGLLVGIATEFR